MARCPLRMPMATRSPRRCVAYRTGCLFCTRVGSLFADATQGRATSQARSWKPSGLVFVLLVLVSCLL